MQQNDLHPKQTRSASRHGNLPKYWTVSWYQDNFFSEIRFFYRPGKLRLRNYSQGLMLFVAIFATQPATFTFALVADGDAKLP